MAETSLVSAPGAVLAVRAARARRVAWALVATAVVGGLAQAVLLARAGVPLLSRTAVDDAFPVIPVALVTGAWVGAIIVSRTPGHRVGWLLCAGQAGSALGLGTGALARAMLSGGLAGPPMIGHLAAWVSRLLGAPWALASLAALFLLVPDGRLPSRRWRPVAALLLASCLVVVGVLLVAGPAQATPGGIAGVPRWLELASAVGQLGVAAGLVAGVVALVVRLRRARGVERQQLRWVASGGAALATGMSVYLLGYAVAGGQGPALVWVSLAFHLGYLAVPVTAGVAVLRYRLYDVDLVLSTAVALAVLAASVTVGYVVVVTAATALLGGTSAVQGQGASAVAFVVVALALQPLRHRLRRLADRVVYGPAAVPYEALAAFTRQVAATSTLEDLLPRVATAAALATGARSARATLEPPDAPALAASWPAAGAPRPDVVLPVLHGGERLGELTLELPAGRRLRRSQRELLQRCAGQAGLAFQNARLDAALAGRAQALQRDTSALAGSRRRLVTATYTERDRVAEAIRSQVLVHLAAVPSGLDRADALLAGDDAAGAREVLDAVRAQVERALEALRVLTRGVFPAMLQRRGLVPALTAAAAGLDPPAAVSVGDGVEACPLGERVATAAYFTAVECLRGLRGGPDRGVALALVDGGRSLRVVVEGVPARGEQGGDVERLADRVQAAGGTLEVTVAAPARRVEVLLPLAPPDDPAARTVPDAVAHPHQAVTADPARRAR